MCACGGISADRCDLTGDRYGSPVSWLLPLRQKDKRRRKKEKKLLMWPSSNHLADPPCRIRWMCLGVGSFRSAITLKMQNNKDFFVTKPEWLFCTISFNRPFPPLSKNREWLCACFAIHAFVHILFPSFLLIDFCLSLVSVCAGCVKLNSSPAPDSGP